MSQQEKTSDGGGDDDNELGPRLDNVSGAAIGQQILETLQAQTELLRSMDTKLGLQLELLRNQARPNNRRHQQRGGSVPPQTVQGAWEFCQSAAASRQRKHNRDGTTKSYGKIEESSGLVLIGEDLLYTGRDHPSVTTDIYGYGGQARNFKPNWSARPDLRELLPELAFEDKKELKHESGVYSLTIRYNCCEQQNITKVSGIIVGEIEFNNEGFVLAEGADWDRLLSNQRQTQLPYSRNARGVPTWQRQKISEKWENDDELKFQIDTNENTIVFQRNSMPKKTFWNVLAFTNNRKFPEHLQAYAFCGWCNVSGRHSGGAPAPIGDVTMTIIP